MEPIKFYFDVRDIFKTPRLALSGKKIWLFLKANLLGFAGYWIFSYLAMLINGNGLMSSVEQFGLYPCIYGIETPSILSVAIYWIGVIIWMLAIFFACTGVARITYKQLKGDDFYTVADAQKFVKENRAPIFMSWISILIITLLFILGAAFFALIGKIPILGELLFVLLYLGYFFGAIFTIYTLIVFLVSFVYSPAIVATMEENTLGTVFQSYSITWSQSWRIIAYNLVLLLILGIGVFILKWFWLSAYKFINLVFGMNLLMGEKLRNITGWATDLVNPGLTLCNNLYSLLSLKEGMVLTTSEYVAGTILAIVFFILLMSILSYSLSILSVGETIILTILKKKSNNENLLERADEDSLPNEEDIITNIENKKDKTEE